MTQPYKYRITKDELAKVLDECFSSEELGDLETTCYRLSKTPMTLDEIKEYCQKFEPHIGFIKSNSIGEINKSDLLTYALQVFYDITWTREFFSSRRFNRIFEIKEHLGLVKEQYDKAKHKWPKEWWLKERWARVQKSIENIKDKEQKEYLRSKGIHYQ